MGIEVTNMKILLIRYWISEKLLSIILKEKEIFFGGEKVTKPSNVGRNGRNDPNNQVLPEALIDSQRAEEALKQVKKRSGNC